MYSFSLAKFAEERDLQALFAWRNSTDWKYLVSERNKVARIETFVRELDNCHKKHWKEHRMILNADGEPIGTIFGYLFSEEKNQVKIGTYVQRKHRSNPGIAAVFVSYCELFFEDLGVKTIICDTYEYNRRVISLLSRIGFEEAEGFVSLRKCGSRKFGLKRFSLSKDNRSKLYRRLS